jgi:hypothetical protein
MDLTSADDHTFAHKGEPQFADLTRQLSHPAICGNIIFTSGILLCDIMAGLHLIPALHPSIQDLCTGRF